MGNILAIAGSGSKSISLVLGTGVLIAAVASGLMGMELREIADWAREVFSATFMVILGIMLAGFAYCLVRMVERRRVGLNGDVWLEAASHLAGGVATVALTYTLLGISLGIGTLAGQEVNAETVQTIIGELTSHFSLAFMTTGIGLPVSAALRAAIHITDTYLRSTPVTLRIGEQS
ncbi:MAG: hypothetical protein HN632_02810 [Rhodospirillaceae bacterium]|nr:hypothetical protein [Rhodospirillaceae bacterium]